LSDEGGVTPTNLMHVTRSGRGWPSALDTIEASPGELWLRGRPELLAFEPRVAVIGTRAPTPYGDGQARRFASALARAGVVVVSGLARGIDSAAHEAALEAGGATIGVLGSGVDCPWPAGPLAERMALEGLLLSEYAPGTAPRRHHFPERNRLISGLCSAVVVIEAAAASGSLITARWAIDQGRSVHALPGRVDHPMARGCHRLLREGAWLVEDPEEVLAELGIAPFPGSMRGDEARSVPDEARALLDTLRGESLSTDELAERTGRALADVLSTLVELEVAGCVIRGTGAIYRLAP